MIGKIKGKLTEFDNNSGLVETTSGIFYLVFLPSSFLDPSFIGKEIELYTYLQLKEETIVLFGFKTKEEIDFFKLLLTVSGIGPKIAFNIVNFSNLSQLKQAIKENDPDYLNQIPGLGKKTALKIIVELSQKLKNELEIKKLYFTDEDKLVFDALISLGFEAKIIKKILPRLPKHSSLEERIQQAIKMIK